MRLFIAEKPSLARAIASALPQPQRKDDGCIWLANGDCVTWCVGHLLELAEPEDYDPALKAWRLDTLPFIPTQFKRRPKASGRAQLARVKQLVWQAQCLVHAGDPDREGQLLVDEVLEECKAARRLPVQRLLIRDLTPSAIGQALGDLRPNSDFLPLSQSALARTHADWLYGINMTRAYSLAGQRQGYQGVLSVGRVQTPVLGLVVQRDLAIAQFTSHTFHDVDAEVEMSEVPGKPVIKARWQPSASCEAFLDSEGRVISRPLAEHVVARVTGQPAQVVAFERQLKRQAPPLPYSLSALQIDAAKRWGMSAQAVLDACQALYEQHQLITYPRSDCRYLPEAQYKAAPEVMSVVAHNLPDLAAVLQEADLHLRSKCWNDSQVQAHHAIIPTEKTQALNALPLPLQQLYRLICQAYAAQFFPACVTENTQLELRIAGGLFKASGLVPKAPGWKRVMGAGEESEQRLPEVKLGDQGLCLAAAVHDKQTQPPKAFTDASLLAAMTGIARFVQNPALKAVLRDTDGIGTEATRAGIIELLFKRQYLCRDGKAIRATAKGRALIAALPPKASSPDMTAHWEQRLGAIAQGQLQYQDFVAPLCEQLKQLIAQSHASVLPAPEPGSQLVAAKRSRRYAAKNAAKGKASPSQRARGAERQGAGTGSKSRGSAKPKAFAKTAFTSGKGKRAAGGSASAKGEPG
jgi:DNA topoisomerase III